MNNHNTHADHTRRALILTTPRAAVALLICFFCAYTGLTSAQRRAAPAANQDSRRIAPPAAVTCDRNRLTVYSGRVVAYRRTPAYTTLTIDTDWDTTERIRIRHTRERSPHPFFLIDGQETDAADIRRIELRPNALRPGARVNAWVCADERSNPVVDWLGIDDSPAPPAQRATRRTGSR